MKKKLLLSLLLALALLLALPGAARAETLVSLGSFSAGSEVDIALIQSENLPDFSADGLPEGLRVEREDRSGGALLVLRGTPLYAGDYRFTVEAGEVVVCAMSIIPAAPSVTVAPMPAAATRAALDVVARSPLLLVSRVDSDTIELCAV